MNGFHGRLILKNLAMCHADENFLIKKWTYMYTLCIEPFAILINAGAMAASDHSGGNLSNTSEA